MGRIAKHTDLSWEVPGLRADVDVPLEYPAFLVPDVVTWANAEWHDDPDRERRDGSPASHRLKPLSAEGLTTFTAVSPSRAIPRRVSAPGCTSLTAEESASATALSYPAAA